MARIALDAMGGDHAPGETVAGAVAACAEGVDVVLVGDHPALEVELKALEADLPIVHAPEVIGMSDDPTRAIREKRSSSIVTCARMVKTGEASGFVSAGSTGAAMASAAILMGRLEGVLRPTIASVFPTPGSPTVVLDSGANPEVKAEHLLQWALMGSVLAEVSLGIRRPRVGLLNIGEERSKGRPLEREAYELLGASEHLRFVGNVEGRVLASDEVDVIVTDGFTGNVFLKTTEGAASLVARLVLEALAGLDPGTLVQVMEKLGPIRERLDYETYGGAYLLGVDGVVVIAHGSSTRRSVLNALRMAREGAEHGLVEKVFGRVQKG